MAEVVDWLEHIILSDYLLSATLLSALVIVTVIWLNASGRHGKKLPPGLPALPVLGSIPFLGLSGTDDHFRYTELAKTYGQVYSFWIANKLVVVLNGYEAIRTAFLDQSTTFADRAFVGDSPLLKYVNPNVLGIVAPSYNSKSKKERAVSVAILKEFGFGRDLMESRIQQEVDSLVLYIRELNGCPSDIHEALAISVSNVIGSITLGERYPIAECEPLKRALAAMEANTEKVSKTIPMNFFPLLAYLPSYKKMMKTFIDNDKVLREFIGRCIANHEAAHHTGKENDFVDAFINRMGPEYKFEHLYFIVSDFFGTGTETAMTSIRWALIYMINYPTIQKRVQDELDREVGRGRPARLDDKSRLPYIEAVTMEILRHGCVAPLTLPHMNGEHDAELCGYHIPAKTMVIGNMWSVLRDPVLWPEPDLFRPERFLDDSGKIIHRAEFIPFSLGRRSCLGEVLAKQEMFLFICGLMQNFTIRAPPGIDKLDEIGHVYLTRVPLPFQIVAEPRI